MSFFAALRATWAAILRDKGLIPFFLLGAPFYAAFYPWAYSTEAVRGVPVEVVDLDASALSRDYIRALQASPGLVLQGTGQDLPAAQARMADGEVAGVIVLPRAFARDVLRGDATAVEVWGTGAFPVQDKVVLESAGVVAQSLALRVGVLRQILHGAPTAWARQGGTRPPAYVEQPLYNLVRGYGSYVVAAVAILIVHQLMLIGGAALVGTWREAAVLLPGRSLSGFCGVWAALSLLAWPCLLFMVGPVFVWQDYPRGGNLAGSIALGGLFALTLGALSLLLGAVLRDRERAIQALLVTSIPLLFLSGIAYPHEAMPAPLQALAAMLPATPAIQGFVKLNQMGAAWSEVGQEATLLAAQAAAFAALAWALARRR